MRNQIGTYAKVQITIEVNTGSWGPDCTTKQVFDQASEEAKGRVRNAFQKIGSDYKLIGEPVVTAVTYSEEKR